MADSFDIGSAYFYLGINSDQYRKGWEEATRTAADASNKIQSSINQIGFNKELLNELGALGNVLNYTGLPRMFDNVGKAALSASSQMQAYNLTLQTLARSTEEFVNIQATIKKLDVGAVTTPQLEQAAVRFTALGDTIKSIGLEKSITAVEELALVFSKGGDVQKSYQTALLGTAKAFAGSTRGAEILKNQMGFTDQKAREFGANFDSMNRVLLHGGNNLELYQQAVVRYAASLSGNGQIITDHANTLAGAQIRLKDSTFGAAAALGDAMAPAAVKVMNTLANLLNSFTNMPTWVHAATAAIGGMVMAMGTVVTGAAALKVISVIGAPFWQSLSGGVNEATVSMQKFTAAEVEAAAAASTLTAASGISQGVLNLGRQKAFQTRAQGVVARELEEAIPILASQPTEAMTGYQKSLVKNNIAPLIKLSDEEKEALATVGGLQPRQYNPLVEEWDDYGNKIMPPAGPGGALEFAPSGVTPEQLAGARPGRFVSHPLPPVVEPTIWEKQAEEAAKKEAFLRQMGSQPARQNFFGQYEDELGVMRNKGTRSQEVPFAAGKTAFTQDEITRAQLYTKEVGEAEKAILRSEGAVAKLSKGFTGLLSVPLQPWFIGAALGATALIGGLETLDAAGYKWAGAVEVGLEATVAMTAAVAALGVAVYGVALAFVAWPILPFVAAAGALGVALYDVGKATEDVANDFNYAADQQVELAAAMQHTEAVAKRLGPLFDTLSAKQLHEKGITAKDAETVVAGRQMNVEMLRNQMTDLRNNQKPDPNMGLFDQQKSFDNQIVVLQERIKTAIDATNQARQTAVELAKLERNHAADTLGITLEEAKTKMAETEARLKLGGYDLSSMGGVGPLKSGITERQALSQNKNVLAQMMGGASVEDLMADISSRKKTEVERRGVVEAETAHGGKASEVAQEGLEESVKSLTAAQEKHKAAVALMEKIAAQEQQMAEAAIKHVQELNRLAEAMNVARAAHEVALRKAEVFQVDGGGKVSPISTRFSVADDMKAIQAQIAEKNASLLRADMTPERAQQVDVEIKRLQEAYHSAGQQILAERYQMENKIVEMTRGSYAAKSLELHKEAADLKAAGATEVQIATYVKEKKDDLDREYWLARERRRWEHAQAETKSREDVLARGKSVLEQRKSLGENMDKAIFENATRMRAEQLKDARMQAEQEKTKARAEAEKEGTQGPEGARVRQELAQRLLDIDRAYRDKIKDSNTAQKLDERALAEETYKRQVTHQENQLKLRQSTLKREATFEKEKFDEGQTFRASQLLENMREQMKLERDSLKAGFDQEMHSALGDVLKQEDIRKKYNEDLASLLHDQKKTYDEMYQSLKDQTAEMKAQKSMYSREKELSKGSNAGLPYTQADAEAQAKQKEDDPEKYETADSDYAFAHRNDPTSKFYKGKRDSKGKVIYSHDPGGPNWEAEARGSGLPGGPPVLAPMPGSINAPNNKGPLSGYGGDQGSYGDWSHPPEQYDQPPTGWNPERPDPNLQGMGLSATQIRMLEWRKQRVDFHRRQALPPYTSNQDSEANIRSRLRLDDQPSTPGGLETMFHNLFGGGEGYGPADKAGLPDAGWYSPAMQQMLDARMKGWRNQRPGTATHAPTPPAMPTDPGYVPGGLSQGPYPVMPALPADTYPHRGGMVSHTSNPQPPLETYHAPGRVKGQWEVYADKMRADWQARKKVGDDFAAARRARGAQAKEWIENSRHGPPASQWQTNEFLPPASAVPPMRISGIGGEVNPYGMGGPPVVIPGVTPAARELTGMTVAVTGSAEITVHVVTPNGTQTQKSDMPLNPATSKNPYPAAFPPGRAPGGSGR